MLGQAEAGEGGACTIPITAVVENGTYAVSASAVTLGAHIEIGMLVEHASAVRRMGQTEAPTSIA